MSRSRTARPSELLLARILVRTRQFGVLKEALNARNRQSQMLRRYTEPLEC